MRGESRRRGQTGESVTADYLTRQGYAVLERNYHSRYGEVDIIARKGECLAFVEVKLRKNGAFSAPREAVTPAKQRRLIRTALLYLQETGFDLQPRFDVAEVYRRGEENPRIEYYEGAFDGTGWE